MSESVLVSGINDALNNAATEYNLLCSAPGQLWDATQANGETYVALAGELSALRIVLSGSPGVGKSYAFTVVKNGSDTAITVTISDAATSGNYSGAAVAVSAGDLITLKVVPSGTPTARAAHWTSKFNSTTAAQSLLMATNGDSTNNAATRYHAPMGRSGAGEDTEAQARQIIACAGTLTKFYVRLSAAPGAGKAFIHTVRINGADTGITVTISDAATTGSDLSNTASVSAGDLISISRVRSSNPTAAGSTYGLGFTATTDGQFNIMGATNDALNNAATEYQYLSLGAGDSGSWTATEADRDSLGQSMTLKALYVALEAAPGAGTTWTLTVREGAADTVLAVAISDAATTGNDVEDETIDDDDLLGMKAVATGAASATNASWGIRGFITPAGGATGQPIALRRRHQKFMNQDSTRLFQT